MKSIWKRMILLTALMSESMASDQLVSASRTGDTSQVRELLAKGVHANSRAADGMTPLIAAAIAGDRENVEILLNHGAAVHDSYGGGTAAYWAAKADQRSVVYLLVDHGAMNPLETDELASAIQAKDGAKINLGLYSVLNVNKLDRKGYSPLMYAIGLDQDKVAQRLLNRGARINVQSDDGYTPLMIAAYLGNRRMVKFCLENGAKTNLRHSNGRTALMMATWKADSAVLAALITAGANINMQDREGWTALMFAAWSRDMGKFDALKQAGADTEVENDDGITAEAIKESREYLPDSIPENLAFLWTGSQKTVQ